MTVRKVCVVFLVLLVAMLASTASAQVTSIPASDVIAYFGSQNDAVQISNPTGFNPWPAAGPNPPAFYGTINQLPGVPAPPGSIPPSNITPFAPTASGSSFNDGFGNLATSNILGLISGSSGTADDALVAMNMNLIQTSGGYAYEQMNFDIDYTVSNLVNTTGTAGTLPGLVTRTYTVTGTVGNTAGSWVAFGGQMNFWNGTTNASLGAPLLFNYFNGSAGTFSASVTASSAIAAVNFPDVLRITGDFFLIGDPSTIQVQSVPEPSTMVLLASASAGLLFCGRRRRAKARASR